MQIRISIELIKKKNRENAIKTEFANYRMQNTQQ